MKKLLLFCLSVLLCTLVYAQTSEIPPLNPNSTPEAEKLLSRLYKSVEEGKIISGLHHNQLMMPNYVYDLERIKEASSKTPMIWGGDLAWDARQVVEIATMEYNKGRIVTLMWHVNRPFDRTARVDFKHQTQGEFTQSQWDELVTEGSEMHGMWLEQVDSISNYLKILKDRNIPVLWRPYHEMNGEWFWWGDRRGENGFKKLWRMLYERMVDYHHLDNLIWVWNANAPRVIPNDTAMAYDLYYPGHQYVDVLATDVYHNDWKQEHHDQLVELGEGKLIALGELGDLPTPEKLAAMNKFAWFMIWTGFTHDRYNTLEEIRDIFTLRNVVNYGTDFSDQDWASLGRYEKANSDLTVRPKAVFMGDSITQCWYDNDPSFFNNNNFACRGISGQTTSHMLVRMRKDVVNLNPKYVVILAGTNDIAKNNGFIEVDDIYGNIVSMCEIAKANRIKPVICSVLPVKKYKWRPEVTDCADRIIRLNAMLEEYAKENKCIYVDYHSPMKDSENGLPEKYSYDGVHLNTEGYDVIEKIILNVLK